MSKPGKVLKGLCKKLGVRLTVKRNGKRVYKSVAVLKRLCKSKKKKKVVKRKRRFGTQGALESRNTSKKLFEILGIPNELERNMLLSSHMMLPRGIDQSIRQRPILRTPQENEQRIDRMLEQEQRVVAPFININLPWTDFQLANLQGANLRGAILRRAMLTMANLQGANLRWANLQGSDLREADLEGADLRWANLQGASLYLANLQRANLVRANLQGAGLRGTDLSGAHLSRAHLVRANLSKTLLGRAHLVRANLEGANLQEANLRRADLRGANLQGADLRGADLQGAILRGAELRGAVYNNNPVYHVLGDYYYEKTKFPRRFNIESRGMINNNSSLFGKKKIKRKRKPVKRKRKKKVVKRRRKFGMAPPFIPRIINKGIYHYKVEEDGRIRIIYNDESNYHGEFKLRDCGNGNFKIIKHGKGRLYTKDFIYDGEWENDRKKNYM